MLIHFKLFYIINYIKCLKEKKFYMTNVMNYNGL